MKHFRVTDPRARRPPTCPNHMGFSAGTGIKTLVDKHPTRALWISGHMLIHLSHPFPLFLLLLFKSHWPFCRTLSWFSSTLMISLPCPWSVPRIPFSELLEFLEDPCAWPLYFTVADDFHSFQAVIVPQLIADNAASSFCRSENVH